MINKNYQTQKEKGYLGENLARKFLNQQGYAILHSNYCILGGEIDLIAKHNDTIVFIEVKTRTNKAFGEAEQSINGYKKFKLLRTIFNYLSEFNLLKSEWRLDALCIFLDIIKNKGFIKHYPNILLQ